MASAARIRRLQVSLAHAEARLDAARRKCSTGYGCGSTCISVQKECRSEGGAATSKERIKRLEQLARGELKQRGIGGLKPDAAGRKAEELKTARTAKAQELLGQRQTARAAAKAQPAAKGPRGAAETMQDSGDYEFARKSSVQNAGEDLLNSARHRRNAFRTIEEAEASGQVEKLLTRDNLAKNFPTDLIEGVNAQNVLSRLEAHYSLKAFPNLSAKEVEDYIKGQERRKARGESHTSSLVTLDEVDAKTVRKQYFDTFQDIRGFVEANRDLPEGQMRRELTTRIGEQIRQLRKTVGTGYSRNYADPYNPVANALIDMQRRLMKRGKTSVGGQLNEFAKALKASMGGQYSNPQETMSRTVEAATKIMEGSSLAQALGKEGTGKSRFSAADLYVAPARRKGGRSVGGSIENATEQIVKRSGFRGLQYGNSVTDDERKHHVQKAAEAMVDLADMLDMPDEAISIKGTLGLAIGARGRGTAMAHYEPGMKVINLTRKRGIGTLAHEWGHALDNYAAGGAGAFLSGSLAGASKEKREAMAKVVASWETTGFVQQVYAAIREEKRQGKLVNQQYWLSREEMFARSFEAYVQLKLSKAGRENTYLTQPPGHPFWPSQRQVEQMEPVFDALMARFREEDFPGGARRDSREARVRRFAQWLQ